MYYNLHCWKLQDEFGSQARVDQFDNDVFMGMSLRGPTALVEKICDMIEVDMAQPPVDQVPQRFLDNLDERWPFR